MLGIGLMMSRLWMVPMLQCYNCCIICRQWALLCWVCWHYHYTLPITGLHPPDTAVHPEVKLKLNRISLKLAQCILWPCLLTWQVGAPESGVWFLVNDIAHLSQENNIKIGWRGEQMYRCIPSLLFVVWVSMCSAVQWWWWWYSPLIKLKTLTSAPLPGVGSCSQGRPCAGAGNYHTGMCHKMIVNPDTASALLSSPQSAIICTLGVMVHCQYRALVIQYH